MGAYNGRLLPRSIFGLPLEGVVLSGAAFCFLVLLLLPGSGLHILRPFFLLGCCASFIKARQVINAGIMAVIAKPLKEEGRLIRQRMSVGGESLK